MHFHRKFPPTRSRKTNYKDCTDIFTITDIKRLPPFSHNIFDLVLYGIYIHCWGLLNLFEPACHWCVLFVFFHMLNRWISSKPRTESSHVTWSSTFIIYSYISVFQHLFSKSSHFFGDLKKLKFFCCQVKKISKHRSPLLKFSLIKTILFNLIFKVQLLYFLVVLNIFLLGH